MTSTPDEIKKGLEEEIPVHYHIDGEPRLTPRLLMDMQWLHKDALALIQQLEKDNDQLRNYIRLLQAERDAAVADIRLAYTSYVGACQTCMRVKDQYDCDSAVGCAHCADEKFTCQSCDNDYCNWQWRGVQKEESPC